jgi:cellobiose epimerase
MRTDDATQSMAEQVRTELYGKIIPFWNRMVDPVHGGFFGYVGSDNIIGHSADKGAVKMARILWSYSALHIFDGNPAHKPYADAAYEYVRDVLTDKTHGGVYWKSSYDGLITNDAKHIYAQSFAIYGLSAYARAFSDQKALGMAMRIFDLIEEKAKTAPGSYTESFDRAWNPTDNTIMSDGVIVPVHTTNSVIHLIEAYTELYVSSKDDRVRSALRELITKYVVDIFDGTRDVSHMYFDQRWQPMSDKSSFGHDIETSWLIDRALLVTGLDIAGCPDMTSRLARHVIDAGYSDGLVSSIPDSTDGIPLLWWIQAEAAVGFHNHFTKTKDRVFHQASKKTILTTIRLLSDPRPEGEWFWSVDRKGHPLPGHGISENWKANYHNVRACIELIVREKNHEIS